MKTMTFEQAAERLAVPTADVQLFADRGDLRTVKGQVTVGSVRMLARNRQRTVEQSSCPAVRNRRARHHTRN